MSIAAQTVKASLRQKGICQIPRHDLTISHTRRGFPYLSVSCPSVPAVPQRQSESEPSLTAGRYPAGCKASACQERGSASQSGTAALLCKERETRYCDEIPWRWEAGYRCQDVLCSGHKVIELPSALLQSLQRSGFSGGLQTDHHALQSKQTLSPFLLSAHVQCLRSNSEHPQFAKLFGCQFWKSITNMNLKQKSPI